MKNNAFVHFAGAFLMFRHFAVLFLSITWIDLLWSCGRREHMMKNVQFFLLSEKRWFQFNSRIVRTHFASVMTLNDWEMIAETWSHITWRSRRRRRLRVCLSSLVGLLKHKTSERFGFQRNCGVAVSVGKWNTKIWYQTSWQSWCFEFELLVIRTDEGLTLQ